MSHASLSHDHIEELVERKQDQQYSKPEVSQIASFQIDGPECVEGNEKKYPNPIMGYVFIMICILLFCCSLTLCKYVFLDNPHIEGFDYAFFRGITCMLSGTIAACYSKVNILKISQPILIAVIIRILTGLIAMPLFYIAIKYLPPSQAAVSQSIHPMIGMIYAYIFLGERFPKKNIVFLICACGGVLLINFTKVTSDENEVDSDKVKYGILCSIISLIFIATMVVCAKQITNHADPIFSPFYFSFGMFLAAVILILFQRDRLHFEHYRKKDVFLLILSCICSYLSHSFQSYATTYTLASNLQPLSCSTP